MSSFRDRIVQRATRRYLAGPRLADAVARSEELGRPTTLAFWDGPGDSPRAVAAAHEAAVAAIAARRIDAYVSIKLPSLGDERVTELAAAAAAAGVLLHFDSLAESEAERTLELACRLSKGGCAVGATLPGCWSRSVRDAERLAAAGVRIRIVKGQWPGDRDPGEGFRAVVEAAARAQARVAVATHDEQLAHASLSRLPGAELELLLGLPTAPVLRAADSETKVRIYVPYGRGYLPYAVRRAHVHPVTFWWLARDLAVGHR